MTTELKLKERYHVRYIRKTDTATNEVKEPEIPKINQVPWLIQFFAEYYCCLIMVALWQQERKPR